MPKIATLKPKIKTIKTSNCSSFIVERIRGWKLQKIRERILKRDNYTCQVCGRVSVDLEIHHDRPLHLGGQEADTNRISLCKECHAKRTEKEQAERL